ncbi:MAG TPA: DeoR/GlpR family DNA-binding transcription regulator [Plantibacter sp.]|uniref:DeoR/GlpR family DNA-binding transcription regulator n=1 Tax=unclassified Plantibacter TaxID=2624265 RepID=UPI002C8CF861|nr:DeoR/GlpR family DNA-binding transcription regulator [Plantibacter sp.]
MATTGTLGAEERRARLTAILERDGSIRLEDAAAELDVSSMTVRRDLADLEQAGVVRRVRGGAIPTLRPRTFTERSATGIREKGVIVEKLRSLIPNDGAIAIDASSTAGGISRLLGGSALTVATNSYPNFLLAGANREISAILVGGQAESRTDSFIGPIACQAAGSLLYRRFFLSAAAVDPVIGSSEVTLEEAQVKQAFARASDETILVAASSKLGQRAMAVGFALADIDLLVTELDPADPALDAYRGAVDLL